MFICLVIVVFLFLTAGIIFSFYISYLNKNLNRICLHIDNLLDAIKELKRGNLAKQIKYNHHQTKTFLNKVVNKLSEKTRFSIEEFNNITIKPLNRLCYVGADSYLEGRIAGKKMAELIEALWCSSTRVETQIVVFLRYLQRRWFPFDNKERKYPEFI